MLSLWLQLATDINLAVSVEAIQAIGNLARGLRNHFAASSRFLLPVLLVSNIELLYHFFILHYFLVFLFPIFFSIISWLISAIF